MRAVELALRAAPDGLSEYQLMGRLQAVGLLAPFDTGDSLSLFRNHFSLFHTLYKLRDQLLAVGAESLSISPLLIRIVPHARSNRDELDAYDVLRDYYLDLDQLAGTDRRQVDEMLSRFWRRIQRDSARDQALSALGLSDPVDNATIKRRYRSLVMRHHPDRGGNAAEFQALNEALRVLL